MAGRDADGAVENRAPQAQESVGDPAARQGGKVDARAVDADDGRRLPTLEAEAALHERRRHEEDEERAQPVVGETLPHLREEERREPWRGPAEPRSITG